MSENEIQVEKWVFGGSRISGKGQRVHAWVDESGAELLFKPQGHPAVGYVYGVRVVRNGDRISKYPDPEFTNERADTALIEELSVKHKAAETRLSQLSRERAAKKDDPLESAINELCRLAKFVPVNQRTALVAHIINRVTKAWYSE